MESELAEIHERKAKTQKGKKYLEKFKSVANEGPRRCLVLKGNKTSNRVQSFLDLWVRKLKNQLFFG